MPDQERVEDAVRTLVIECCPQHAAVGAAGPQVVGAIPWLKIVEVVKILLPVILEILSKFQEPAPTPDPKPPFPV